MVCRKHQKDIIKDCVWKWENEVNFQYRKKMKGEKKEKKWEWSIPNEYHCYFHFLDDETNNANVHIWCDFLSGSRYQVPDWVPPIFQVTEIILSFSASNKIDQDWLSHRDGNTKHFPILTLLQLFLGSSEGD